MKNRPVLFTVFILLLLTLPFLAACDGGEPVATPTPTPSPLQLEIEEAISQFEALEVDDYTVRVTYRRPAWDPQIMDIEVVDGQATILDQNCIPERNCGLRDVEAADFTLPAIFAVVRQQAAFPEGITQISYHDEYGFPRIIATAEEGSFEISNFQPTE